MDKTCLPVACTSGSELYQTASVRLHISRPAYLFGSCSAIPAGGTSRTPAGTLPPDVCPTGYTPLLPQPLEHLVEHLLMADHLLAQQRLVCQRLHIGGVFGDALHHLLQIRRAAPLAGLFPVLP